jgi:hypothetical protein
MGVKNLKDITAQGLDIFDFVFGFANAKFHFLPSEFSKLILGKTNKSCVWCVAEPKSRPETRFHIGE